MPRLSLLVLVGIAAGCGASPAPPAAAVRTRSLGLVLHDLAAVALNTESLAAEPALREDLANLWSPQGLEYVVQCALTGDQQLELDWAGERLRLTGSSGYAPEWADGPCDESCQEWVTACFLARGNAYPVHARIWFVAAGHPRGVDADDPIQGGYPVQEGAFFGNYFQDPPRIHACRGRGRDPFYDVVRACTHPGSPCGIQSVGPCNDDDGAVPHACESLEGGAFRACHARLIRGGSAPAGARTWTRVVTTWLPRTGFAGGLDAAVCREGSAPGEFPVQALPAVPGEVGDRCATDDDCATALGCALRTGPGVCSKGCTDSGDPAGEEAECGAGNACRSLGDEGTICVRRCTAVMAGGAGCDAGEVCTGQHLFSGGAADTVCTGFCRTDADCRGSHCNPRTGSCNVKRPADPALLADGEPCTDAGACRGFCLPFGDDRGLCASFVTYEGRDTPCPDPGIEPLFAKTLRDDLGLCVFRPCATDFDCRSPLICSGGSCTYPG